MKSTIDPRLEQTASATQSADARPSIRHLARSLALASHSADPEVLKEPRIQLAKLTAGLDPDAVDPHSADFRFGASEALGRVLNGLAEQAMSASTARMLLKRQRLRVLNGIAANSGGSQKMLSERLDIAESNLSKYVRELAGVGLIEPIPASKPKGKAWKLTPWGVKTYFSVVSGPAVSTVPEAEIAEGLRGAHLEHAQISVAPASEQITIPKDEFYERLEQALSRNTDSPLHLTTLFPGDLRSHDRPWKLHDRVFNKADMSRPVEWLFVTEPGSGTDVWLPDLVRAAVGNKQLTVWTRHRPVDITPTVQVLDEEGLVYPLPPRDEGLVQDRDDALAAWNDVCAGAKLQLKDGAPEEGEVIGETFSLAV